MDVYFFPQDEINENLIEIHVENQNVFFSKFVRPMH